MDTITAALCETCPEADRAAWPSGLMCAKAQGADFALTASTFDFSAILQESLDPLPGKETAEQRRLSCFLMQPEKSRHKTDRTTI
jgi:hypothetical protein